MECLTSQACQQGGHDRCAGFFVQENVEDVSQPRVKQVCQCVCHQVRRKRETSVPITWRMFFPACLHERHKECVGHREDTETNQTWICKCGCHQAYGTARS